MKKMPPKHTGFNFEFFETAPIFAVLTLKRHCLPISQKATKFNKLYIYTHRKKRQSCDFFFFTVTCFQIHRVLQRHIKKLVLLFV